jgi:hypothetical protein
MNRTDNRRVKTSATVLGGAALISMGIIGAWAGGVKDGATAVVSDGSMTTGATTTLTYSGTIAPIVAVPPVKATFFGEG